MIENSLNGILNEIRRARLRLETDERASERERLSFLHESILIREGIIFH